MKEFQNKVAVITGACGGVGSALAQRLAERGCHLALVDISEPALQKTANAVAITGVKVSTHSVDITDKAQVAQLPEAVLTQHGKVKLLINNVGMTYQKSIATHTMDDWEKIVGIN